MTVEATSFLSTSKISNSHEKSAKILKNHKNLIIILLAFVLLFFCILASVFQIYMFNELNKTHEEIEQLKKDVEEIKSKWNNRKLITEINAFNRKYNNQNDAKDQIDIDEKIKTNLIDDDKVKFDDVGDEFEEEEQEELEEHLDDENDDDNYAGFHSGFSDEEYDDDYDLDSLEDDLPEPEKDDDNNNIYEDMKKLTRKTRSITGITEQGVPILEEPYALRRNRTRLAELNREKNPRLKLTWNEDHYNRNIYGQHRRNYDRHRHHHSSNIRHQHQNQDHSNRFAFAAAPVHHIKSFGQKFNESDSTPIPIQTRQSRVMHFEDKTKAFRQVVNKDQLAKLKEQRLPPVEHVQLANGNRRRINQNMPLRKNLELKNAKRIKITAVHYDGDSTKLEETGHESYHGNGKVRMHTRKYMHWKPADWVRDHGMEKFFNMDSSGTLTIHDHGLFLIYAQVYYSDSHDVNGYEIVHNNHVKYQCTTMTHTGKESGPKTNSCYTSGLIHLRNGDRIQLHDVGNNRFVLMQPNKSFFGLIKINLLPSMPTSDISSSTDVEQLK